MRRARGEFVAVAEGFNLAASSGPTSSMLDFLQNVKLRRVPIQEDEDDVPSYTLTPFIERRPISASLRHLDSQPPTYVAQEGSNTLPSLSHWSGREHERSKRQRLSSSSTPPPLYLAVSNGAPHHVIQSLVQADPSSVSHQNSGGLTPLHCAIERYDTPVQVILTLLESCPRTAAMKCRRGYRPLDLIWKRFAQPDSYRSIEARTQASLLCKTIQDALGPLQKVNTQDGGWNSRPCERQRQSRVLQALQDNQALRELWEVMTAFIRAACHEPMSLESSKEPLALKKKRLLHNAVELQCETLLIRFAAAMSPQELLEQDEKSGRVPLHVAANYSNSKSTNLEALAVLDPRAASIKDLSGQIPLQVAIRASGSWEGNMEHLVHAWPKSLEIPDAETGLLPVVLACVDDTAPLDTIFNLMLANPMTVYKSFLRE